jgi:hypothetical protein
MRRVPGFAPQLLLNATVEYWALKIIEGIALFGEVIMGEILMSAERPSQNSPLQPAAMGEPLGGSSGHWA